MENSAGPSKIFPAIQRSKKTHFTCEEKEKILNVYRDICVKNPNNSATNKYEATAIASGVNISSVYRILREHKTNNGQFKAPKKTSGKKRTVLDYIDESVINAIREKVNYFVSRNQSASVDKIRLAIDQDDKLPNIKRTTLYRLLQEIKTGHISGVPPNKRSKVEKLKQTSSRTQKQKSVKKFNKRAPKSRVAPKEPYELDFKSFNTSPNKKSTTESSASSKGNDLELDPDTQIFINIKPEPIEVDSYSDEHLNESIVEPVQPMFETVKVEPYYGEYNSPENESDESVDVLSI